jgi:hypothetical protein
MTGGSTGWYGVREQLGPASHDDVGVAEVGPHEAICLRH